MRKGKAKGEKDANADSDKKRKVSEEVNEKGKKRKLEKVVDNEEDEESSSEADKEVENEVVQVDFDFFDPKEIDYHGVKHLLRQTFPETGEDVESFDFGALADLIIEQKLIGSTVKMADEPDSDPYALLTLINLHHHDAKPFVSKLKEYIKSKASKGALKRISDIFASPKGSGRDAALVFSERLINMPPQIAPPMFEMFVEELEWAVADKEPYDIEYFIFISKTYRETEPQVEDPEGSDDDSGPSGKARKMMKVKKKKRKQAVAPALDTGNLYFQQEDEIIEKHAEFTFDFAISQDIAPDARRTFSDHGIEPARRVLVVHKDKIPVIVAEMKQKIVVA
ncbi:p21-C-terminal region-binding protein-domain-containing protein [Cladochytrium replicatum]|nr:p21-C-terminal region-binding protein-domain-containing protein [Cladochytrium replicatum]